MTEENLEIAFSNQEYNVVFTAHMTSLLPNGTKRIAQSDGVRTIKIPLEPNSPPFEVHKIKELLKKWNSEAKKAKEAISQINDADVFTSNKKPRQEADMSVTYTKNEKKKTITVGVKIVTKETRMHDAIKSWCEKNKARVTTRIIGGRLTIDGDVSGIELLKNHILENKEEPKKTSPQQRGHSR